MSKFFFYRTKNPLSRYKDRYKEIKKYFFFFSYDIRNIALYFQGDLLIIKQMIDEFILSFFTIVVIFVFLSYIDPAVHFMFILIGWPTFLYLKYWIIPSFMAVGCFLIVLELIKFFIDNLDNQVNRFIKSFSVFFSCFVFICSLIFWINFNKSLICFQFNLQHKFIFMDVSFKVYKPKITLHELNDILFSKMIEAEVMNRASASMCKSDFTRLEQKYHVKEFGVYLNYLLECTKYDFDYNALFFNHKNYFYILSLREGRINKWIEAEFSLHRVLSYHVEREQRAFREGEPYVMTIQVPFLNELNWGIDGISLFFIILTTWLIYICFLVSWETITLYVGEYTVCFFFLEFFLLIAFFTTDLLIFYIAFESILIPMFIIVGFWGSRSRKIKAGYQFFLYTLLGSVFLLLAILIINIQLGSTDLETLLLSYEISYQRQLILWWAFFFSFAVKVPMIPFHIWLPEAHVEAPTTGSVILAGILLKLGTYGFIRFTIPLLPYACIYYSPFIFTLSLIAIIYTSLTTLRQIDLKKIIAYSSVAHMNFVTLGIFSLNIYGLEGSIMLMLSHGIVSSALFICIGILYDRCHTRIMKYYGGLTITMPFFSIFFFIFILANLSMPGTSSFIGEFLILIGIFEINSIIAFFSSFSIILSAGYSIWLYNRLMFGFFMLPYKLQIFWLKDLNYREYFILVICIFLVFLLGFYPNIILSYLHLSCINILNYVSDN